MSQEEEELGKFEEEIFVRRVEKRLAAREESDYPWLRRIVGFAIIGGAFYLGWKMLDRQAEVILSHAKSHATVSQDNPSPEPRAQSAGEPTAARLADQNRPGVASLTAETAQTIGECTKGVSAFRLLDLSPAKIKGGEASLETVFSPALVSSAGEARRQVQLQNIRIRTRTGEELRLHASPQTQDGELYVQLFRVADDGLPEPAEFPDEIKDLKGAKLSSEVEARFLALSETPGRALEIERHEAWSFRDKVGAQVIWSNDHIYDLQAFMADQFLACNRTDRRGEGPLDPVIACKCVSRGESIK